MLPLPGPSCALETKSWLELVGRNSLPNGPAPCAAKGEPGAIRRWPSSSTLKLSISDGRVAAPTPVPMRVPTRWVPSPLKRTSPGWVPLGSEKVESSSLLLLKPETSVAADCPAVTDEDQIIVDGDGDRRGTAG